MARPLATIVFTIFVLSASWAVAQPPAPSAVLPPYLGAIDGSIGGLWPITTDESSTPVTGGARFAVYFGKSAVARRLRGEFSFSGLTVRDLEYYDPELGSYAQSNSYVLLFSPTLGLDVLQSSRFHVSLRGGGAWTVDRTTFSLERSEVGEDESPYENVCDLQAFSRRCYSDYGFVGTAGVSVRFFLTRHGSVALGADYNRYSNGWNQMFGSVGWYARRPGPPRP